MSGKYTNMVDIDGKALESAIRSRGLTLAKASRELRRADCFISHTCKQGSIHINTIDLIKLHFGIDFEEYAKKEEPELDIVEDVEVKEVTETAAPAQTVTIDYNMLYQTIYTAVYHAIAKWELNEDQRKDVKEAV